MRRIMLLAVLFSILVLPAIAQQPQLGPALSSYNLRLGGPTIGSSYGIPVHDAQGTLSNEMVIPQGATTPQPLSSIAGVAANAVPKGGSSLISAGNPQNYITGPLLAFPTTQFGQSLSQTAASIDLGQYNGCVMNGAQNGQGTGGLGAYATIDGVALCNSAEGVPELFNSAGTFDATHFFPTMPISQANLAKLNAGTIGSLAGTWIVVPIGAQQYAGWITSWDPDGTSVSVIGWWVLGTSGYQTPTGTQTAYFGVDTKLWAQNGVLQLNSGGFATHALGYELDMVNDQATTADMTGIAVVQLGNFQIRGDTQTGGHTGGSAYQARGLWGQGFTAWSGQDCAFCYDPTIQHGVSPSASGGFLSRQPSGTAFAAQPNGFGTADSFSVAAADGSIVTNGAITNAGTYTDYVFPSGVLGLTITSGGSYTQTPTATIDPAPAGGTSATVSSITLGMGTPHLVMGQGGAGYTSGDLCPIVGGTGTPASVTITATGGVITSVVGGSPGSYTALPAQPLGINCPSGGSGAQISAPFFVSAATVAPGSSGYTTFPAVTFTAAAPDVAAVAKAQVNIGFNVDTSGNVLVGTNGTKLSPGVLHLTAANTAVVDMVATNTAPAGNLGYNVRLLNSASGVIEVWGINAGTNTKLGQFGGTAGANHFRLTGAATGAPVPYGCDGDTNCMSELVGSGTGGGLLGSFIVGGQPTTTIPSNACGVWDDTTHPAVGQVQMTCNFGGTLWKGQLTTSGYPTMPQYTVATLPTCNAAEDGQFAEIVNVLATPTYGAAPDAGGGTIHWPYFCNGTSWTAH